MWAKREEKREGLTGSLYGVVDERIGRRVRGWSYDRATQTASPIEVWCDQECVMTIYPTNLREDVARAGYGDGLCGFEFLLPASVFDGRDHSVIVRHQKGHAPLTNGNFDISQEGVTPHFVRDYQQLVRRLLAEHPLDDAMSLAVGGEYEKFGKIQLAILRYAGLSATMKLLDLGCGSGRLASALSKENILYTGIDVVPELLDFARSRSNSDFKFICHPDLSIPAASDSLDMICAFSVFTHLLHAETYIYMKDAWRALKPKGKIVFSFLEFQSGEHWKIFEQTVTDVENGTAPHLNSFIEREVIQKWSRHLGYGSTNIIGGQDAPWDEGPLGQSTAILTKDV